MSPASPLDPQLSAYVTYPFGLGLGIPASYLRDPLALWGVLNYSRAFGSRPGTASLSLTVALVANTVLTLYAGAGLSLQLGLSGASPGTPRQGWG